MVMAEGHSAKPLRRPSQDGVQNKSIPISPKTLESIHGPRNATFRVERSLTSIRTNVRKWVRKERALEKISP
jgi:hypothetical protein